MAGSCRSPRMRAALLALLTLLALLAAGTVPANAPHNVPDDADGDVTLLRGPASLNGTLDAETVRDARRNGTLRASGTAVRGDTLVVAFRSEQVNASFDRADGADTTARLLAALDRAGGNLSVFDTAHGTERPTAFVDLRGPGVETVRDAPNATFYLRLDTGAAAPVTDDGERLRADWFDRAELAVVANVPREDGIRTLTNGVELRSPRVSLDGNTTGVTRGQPLYADPNGTVRLAGSTLLGPGTELDVRWTAAAADTLLATEETATVRRDGPGSRVSLRFAHDLEPGERVRVNVTADGYGTVLSETLVAGEPPTVRDATATRVIEGPDAGAARVTATARFPDDGFLVVYGPDGTEPVATAHVPGNRRTTATLDVPPNRTTLGEGIVVFGAWDRDGDGEYDGQETDPHWYTASDGGLRVELADPRPGRTPTRTPFRTGSPTETASPPPPGTTVPPTEVSQPGFGQRAAFAALAALLLALACGRSRT